jgi:NhaP-type Na+/H+ or K+/H+ antiporter
MIGKIITAIAGRSVARTIGGASAGPAGAMIGAALPVVLPALARRLGPIGMIAAAVGGMAFTRWLERRNERREGAAVPSVAPNAVLGVEPATPALGAGPAPVGAPASHPA